MVSGPGPLLRHTVDFPGGVLLKFSAKHAEAVEPGGASFWVWVWTHVINCPLFWRAQIDSDYHLNWSCFAVLSCDIL